jgi:probable rRNA maturation factor
MTNSAAQLPVTIEVTLQDARASSDDEVPPSSSFARWASLAAPAIKEPAQLTIRIVDVDESQQLNHDYRGKDKPTNVLSFSYGEDMLPEGIDTQPLLGDLVMCADIVRQEAKDSHRSLNDHWAHLTVHGVLHLRGYDHETRQQADEMEALEIRLLDSLNIKNPYEVLDV